MLTTRIPPGPPLIKSRQHPPMELFTHTHWPTEHLIALYRDARQPRGVNGWMPVDLWSTFRRASAQLASTFLPLQSLAALANIIYQRKIDLQMQKQQKAISAHTTTIRNRRPPLFMALMPYTPGKHFGEYLQLDLLLAVQHITST